MDTEGFLAILTFICLAPRHPLGIHILLRLPYYSPCLTFGRPHPLHRTDTLYTPLRAVSPSSVLLLHSVPRCHNHKGHAHRVCRKPRRGPSDRYGHHRRLHLVRLFATPTV